MPEPSLHFRCGPTTMWTTANVGEAVPGLLTPLTWSLWTSGEPYWAQGFHDMGILSDDELAGPFLPDNSNLGVFFGRAVMNIEMLRRLGDRMPGGSANGAEQALAGAVRPGMVDQPDERFRAAAAMRMPEVAASYPAAMEQLWTEADETWRRWLKSGVDGHTWRTALADGASLFWRAQRYQGLATMFAQGVYGQLAGLVAELGHPGAENVLTQGHGNLDENRMLERLWAVGQGEVTLEDFLAAYGYHGPDEGTVEAPSWREQPELLRHILDRYREVDGASAPSTLIAKLAGQRERLSASLLAEATSEQAATLTALTAHCAALMPYRELGKATFLRGIDLVRLATRFAGADLTVRGTLASPEDISYLTIQELLDPGHVIDPAAIAPRRGERDSYRDLRLPDVFQGEPEPIGQPVAVVADRHDVRGMSASPGVVEGIARVLTSSSDVVEPGDIVVAPMTDPSWVPLFLIAGALVVDVGGPMSHAAIVARELGLPCVIGTIDGTRRIRTGDKVRVDATAGLVTVIGEGA